jgi:putative hydrolase of the HAD superfamily
MIGGVFFDIGGVLLRTEDTTARQKWERRFGLPDWGLADAVFGSQAAKLASLGHGSVAAIWAGVGQRFGLSEAELAELQRDFWAGDRFDEALIAYIAALRPRYRTAVISNAWPDMRGFLMEQPFFAPAFDKLFISAEMGIAKPDPRVFRQALDEMDLQPGEAACVDDVRENVDAAQALGMAGVWYQRGLDVPAALAELGVRG